MENPRITGGSDEFVRLIRRLEQRIANVESKDTGSIFISGQIVTEDPVTGVSTIFGALPDGRYGMQEWVNDTEPPEKPSTPVVKGERAVYEIVWDGLTATGLDQPVDYDKTIVQMSSDGLVWSNVGYFTAAGRTLVADQTYNEEKQFRLVSLDKNSNASVPSEIATSTLVSYMDSPEMNEYILEVESAVSTANTNASNAQTEAQTAQTAAQEAFEAAQNAERLAQEAGNGNENLITNSSFEQNLDTWHTEANPGSISTAEFYSGTQSWQVGTTGGGIYQDGFEVEEGQIYNFEFAYKTIAGYAGAGGLRLQSSTDGITFTNVMTESLVESTSWSITSKDYTVPVNVTHLRARIAFAPGSTMGVWVDSVKLTNVTTLRMLEATANEAKQIAEDAAQTAEDAATAANDAAIAAGNAQTAANGKSKNWYQDTPPAGTLHGDSDIWFDEANDNIPHVWKDGQWVPARDAGIETAITSANDANTAANTAITTASGKNKNTTSTDPAPVNYNGVVGDIWWQKEDTLPYAIFKQSHWDGTVWVEDQLSSGMFAYIDAGDINVGTIDANIIAADSITAFHMAPNTITAESGIIGSLDLGKATVGELNGSRIKAGTLLADRLVVGTGDNQIADPKFTASSELTLARLAASTAGAQWTTPDYIGWNRTGASATTHKLKLGGNVDDIDDPVIPVIPGRRYVVSWNVYADVSTTNTRSVVKWKSTTGTVTTANGANIALTGGNGALSSYKQEFVAPANAAYATIELDFTSHPGGGWLDFRNPVFQLMTDGTIITDDAISTRHINTGSITGDVLDMDYIKGQVVTATMFQGGPAISGGTFQQATFQTSSSPNVGSKMSPTLGFVSYGADQQPVFSVDTAGNAFFRGSVQITGGSVPTANLTGTLDPSKVDGLSTEKINTYDSKASIVELWQDPEDITHIDGGNISTKSITADKILLGDTVNIIPGGSGGDATGWGNVSVVALTEAEKLLFTDEVQHKFMYDSAIHVRDETPNSFITSPEFDVAGLSKYKFSFQMKYPSTTAYIYYDITFYNVNGIVVGSETKSVGPAPDTSGWYYWSIDRVAPTGARYADVIFGWLDDDNPNRIIGYLADVNIQTGSETVLSTSGLISYNDGVETLRLNGVNNLLVGSLMTGNPGTEPYIKMSNRNNIAAMDLWGPSNTPIHSAIWWEHDPTIGRGILSVFAMNDDNLNLSNNSGIKFQSHGFMDIYGRIGEQSRTLKVATIKYTNGLGAAGTSTAFVTDAPITFSHPYPSGTIPFVFVQVQSTATSEVVATVKSVSSTGCTITIVNYAPRNTGTLWVNVLTVLGPLNANW